MFLFFLFHSSISMSSFSLRQLNNYSIKENIRNDSKANPINNTLNELSEEIKQAENNLLNSLFNIKKKILKINPKSLNKNVIKRIRKKRKRKFYFKSVEEFIKQNLERNIIENGAYPINSYLIKGLSAKKDHYKKDRVYRSIYNQDKFHPFNKSDRLSFAKKNRNFLHNGYRFKRDNVVFQNNKKMNTTIIDSINNKNNDITNIIMGKVPINIKIIGMISLINENKRSIEVYEDKSKQITTNSSQPQIWIFKNIPNEIGYAHSYKESNEHINITNNEEEIMPNVSIFKNNPEYIDFKNIKHNDSEIQNVVFFPRNITLDSFHKKSKTFNESEYENFLKFINMNSSFKEVQNVLLIPENAAREALQNYNQKLKATKLDENYKKVSELYGFEHTKTNNEEMSFQKNIDIKNSTGYKKMRSKKTFKKEKPFFATIPSFFINILTKIIRSLSFY